MIQNVNIKAFGKRVPHTNVIEFHVDMDEALWVYISDENKAFGGDLSVWKDVHEKPLIVLGQDESIFEQHMFPSGTWVDKDGKSALRPKGAGYGMMVSAFVSREFGIGLGSLTEDDFTKINNYRDGKDYTIPECADLVGIPKEKSKTKIMNDPSIDFF